MSITIDGVEQPKYDYASAPLILRCNSLCSADGALNWSELGFSVANGWTLPDYALGLPCFTDSSHHPALPLAYTLQNVPVLAKAATANQVTLLCQNPPPQVSIIYCAAYDGNGRMVGISKGKLNENSAATLQLHYDAADYKLFFLNNTNAPLATAFAFAYIPTVNAQWIGYRP